MTYNEALTYLQDLTSFGVKPGLSRITALLDGLENPQQNFRAIHIAGTNGKGSVATMIAAGLTNSSCTTGLFTSPHLTDYTERMKLNGQDISRDEFAAVIADTARAAKALSPNDPPTQFEVLTAAAFLFFSRAGAEYAVIEAGLGGLLDSTNVIAPLITVITNVTNDHAEYCGGTLAGIAEHKSGIIKEGIPVVTAAKDMPLAVIRQKADEKNADVFTLGEDFAASFVNTDGKTQSISFSSNLLGIHDLNCNLSLLGANQIDNAALALMTTAILHNMDERIIRETVTAALSTVSWPGRFERFTLASQDIIIDGAHNAAGAVSLRKNLDIYCPSPRRVFVLGILKDKEADVILGELVRTDDVVITTAPFSQRALTAQELAAKALKCTEFVEAKDDPAEALKRALTIAADELPVVCAGSLYLIGALRNIIIGK